MHASNLFYTEPAMRLCAALAHASLDGKAYLCNSGAEANEAAIKLARKAKPHGDVIVAAINFIKQNGASDSVKIQPNRTPGEVPH